MKKFTLMVLIMILTVAFTACSISVPEEIREQIGDEIANEAEKVIKEDLEQLAKDAEVIGEYIEENAKESEDKGTLGEIKKAASKKVATREKEISTKTVDVTINANTLEEWLKEVKMKEKSLVPIERSFIINANGENEYLGYMIVGKEPLEYKKITMEVSNGPSLGKKSTKTVYINAPSRIIYTLHKHELGFDKSSIGAYLAGLVNMQIVAKRNCNCGYTSQIEWDIPDLSSIGKDKFTGEELYIRTESKVVPK